VNIYIQKKNSSTLENLANKKQTLLQLKNFAKVGEKY